MDWTKGYSSTFRVGRVDPVTWELTGEVGGVGEIEIDRDGTDDAPMLETASVKAVSMPSDEFEAGYLRIVMDAVQGTSSESVPVATLWFEGGRGRYDRGYREDELTGRSVLFGAADDQVGDGSYAPKGVNGARWCADLLSENIDAPVDVTGDGFELPESIVFDLDSSVLEAVWSVLRPNGWTMWIDGRGEVHLSSKPTSESLVLDWDGACILMPGTSYSEDEVSYSREWQPDVYPYSLVRGSLPDYGLVGMYEVTTQRIRCGRGMLTEESVKEVDDAR